MKKSPDRDDRGEEGDLGPDGGPAGTGVSWFHSEDTSLCVLEGEEKVQNKRQHTRLSTAPDGGNKIQCIQDKKT